MEYGDLIWDNCTVGNSELLECVQYESAKVVTGAIAGTSSKSLREELAWEELSTRRKTHKSSQSSKIVNKSTAPYLVDLSPIWRMKDLIFPYELAKILVSIDVELKNSKIPSFLPRFLYGTLLILT